MQTTLKTLCGVLFASTCLAGSAAAQTLESPALKLEVTAKPYGFKVIEKSTGDVLLSHTKTTLASNNVVSEATNVQVNGNTLVASLRGYAGTTSQTTFTFIQPEVLRVVVGAGQAPGHVTVEFADQGEHYYGVWEYPFGGAIDNRGADFDFLGMQRHPDVNYSSARAPFYTTSRKYAVYAETTEMGHYSFAKNGKTTFDFNGNRGLTYDVIYGPSYAQMMQRYVQIAGGSLMPPLWAFDSIWWRDDHHQDLRDVKNAQEKVIDDADRLRALRIPTSAIWLDRPFGTGAQGWGNFDFDPSFPDPAKMVADLKARGMNLIVWVSNRNSNAVFDEGKAKGYMFDYDWPAADITRPEVYDWLKKKWDYFVKLGIKGYKIDRGEEGEMPRSIENQQVILLNKMAAEGMRAVNGDDFFIFSRNANDTSRKYTAVWNGDTQPNLGGMAVSVKGLLRSGAINFPMWGSDTGGYLGAPDKETMARWLAFSAYSPMMEVLVGPKRTVWYDFDEQLIQIARTTSQTHHDLIPTLRSLMYAATQSGMPIARPLVFAYPADGKVADMWDEYLIGDSLLIAPVVTAGATSRSVYLPAGQWLDYNDRSTLQSGGATLTANAPLDVIPVYVKEGAIIARGDIVKSNNNWDANWAPKLRVELFPAASGTSRFDYYTGTAMAAITAASSAQGVDVSVGDLGAPGSVEIYWQNPTRVMKDGKALAARRDYAYNPRTRVLTIPFTGAAKFEIRGGTSIFSR